MNAATYEWGTIRTLWRRDMLRLARERSRWMGVVLQPLIFWLIIGSGMANSFSVEGLAETDYLQYTFPGILVMIVLFATIFATISVVDDRRSGFLQGVLVGPASRTAMVLGKTAGVTTLALLQSVVFLALSPFVGYVLSDIAWLTMTATVILTSVGLTSVGFAMAWTLDSVQAYHAVMSVLLLPLWILSGAMFPPQGNWVDIVLLLNPMSYAVESARAGLNGELDVVSLLVLLLFAVAATGVAVWSCRRKPSQ